MANPKHKRNARTWHTITARMVGKYLEGFGHVLARDVGKKYYVQDGSYFVENDAQMAARLGKAVNPRTLVPAKLKMMPNGTIKVLVSPGAMAKMRVENPSTNVQYIVNWGREAKFFDTLVQAKKYKAGLYSRGLLFGREVKIVRMASGEPSKVVFQKSY